MQYHIKERWRWCFNRPVPQIFTYSSQLKFQSPISKHPFSPIPEPGRAIPNGSIQEVILEVLSCLCASHKVTPQVALLLLWLTHMKIAPIDIYRHTVWVATYMAGINKYRLTDTKCKHMDGISNVSEAIGWNLLLFAQGARVIFWVLPNSSEQHFRRLGGSSRREERGKWHLLL